MKRISFVVTGLSLITALVVVNCTSTQKFAETSTVDTSRKPASLTGASELTAQGILKASSSSSLQISEAYVITDNDASFESKLEAVRSARSGETIRMSYYIYSDDQSSSIFSKELLNAAERGVSVKLMVDYLTNYKFLDLFHMLESKSNGRIQVRLYGRPTELIVRDALFMTRPCPEYTGVPSPTFCSDAKWKNITAELLNVQDKKNYTDFYSGLFLAGLSAKNPVALQSSVMVGQQIDPSKYKGGNTSAEDQAKLKEFFKLVYQAKIHGDIIAALKVNIALSMHGADLKPLMNEIEGRIPFSQMSETSSKDWEHISDYTHHKILVVGNRFFQLGGRNIENSYHMKKNSLSAKYTFIDTDFAAKVTSGGDDVVKAFEMMWNFEPMVADLATVEKFAPFDFIANNEAAKAAAAQCATQPNKTLEDRANLENCLKQGLWMKGGKRLEQRIEDQYAKLEKGIQSYQTEYVPNRIFNSDWKRDTKYSFAIAPEELRTSMITYIENLHYNRANPKDRVYGAMNGQFFLPWREKEVNYGRGIHALWLKGLENTCAVSAKDHQPRRVILHTAYFLPPSNMMRAFTNMIDGTWDCRNVRVTFLTNSFETTDLNIINIYARYQMKAFFDIYSTRKGHFGIQAEARSAQFEYYEYMPILNADGTKDEARKISLHTKLTVLGDDMILGSANADVRSFYMDTNNGVYIRGAKNFIKEYVAWVDQTLANPRRVKNLTPEHSDGTITLAKLQNEDAMFLQGILMRFGWDKKISKENQEELRKLQAGMTTSIVNTIQKIMSKDYIEVYSYDSNSVDQEKRRQQQVLEQQYNRALQVL